MVRGGRRKQGERKRGVMVRGGRRERKGGGKVEETREEKERCERKTELVSVVLHDSP